jgi:hypothetical protein
MRASGKTYKIVHVPLTTVKETLDKDPSNIFFSLHYNRAINGRVAEKDEDVSNSLWPEWNPKKAVDILMSLPAA